MNVRKKKSQLLEGLEDRRLMAVFTVTNVNDSGAGSLRQAILSANAAVGTDTIGFNIAAALKRIDTSTSLPDITGPVIIDGTTQPGYAGTPLVNITGFSGPNNNGLTFFSGSSNSQVKGLQLSGFRRAVSGDETSGNAIVIDTGVAHVQVLNNVIGGPAGTQGSGIVVRGASNTIRGNSITNAYTGIRLEGTVASDNGIYGNSVDSAGSFGSGIVITNGASNNVIGSANVADRNFITGNDLAGIKIDSATAAIPTGNKIVGNWIGFRSDGTASGSGRGIEVVVGNNTQIGGVLAGEANVISHSGTANISLHGELSNDTTVQGNFIGMRADGTTLGTPTTEIGIHVGLSTSATIGGTSAAARNYITGGNVSAKGIMLGAIGGVTIHNNAIGLNPAGNAVGTLGTGIEASESTGATIGGANPGEGNYIANAGNGIQILGSSNLSVVGNQIGMNLAGTAIAGTNGWGILSDSGSSGCQVLNNRIAGTTQVAIDSGTAVTIRGNQIGLSADGLVGLSVGTGILVNNSAIVGGTGVGEGNLIGRASATAISLGEGSGAVVQGNRIGVNITGAATGTTGVGNGIYISTLNNAQIGGTAPGAGNLITKGASGILVGNCSGAKIEGNTFGTDTVGNATGIRFVDTINATVGGINAASANRFVRGTNGVVIENSAGNITIRRNVFETIVTQPIDLGNDGLTPNDAADADTGANTKQNFPILLSADSSSGTNTIVSGILSTSVGTPIIVDYYSSDVATGAKTWLASQTLVTDAGGGVMLNATLPFVFGNQFITATATNLSNAPFGNTSELAPGTQVVGPVDNVAPTVANSGFEFETSQKVKLVFSEDLNASTVAANDLTMTNTTTGQAFVPNSVNYDPATKTARFGFGTILPDGNYAYSLGANKVTDVAGNPNATFNGTTHVLAGDTNRDKTVNFDDLLTLAQNYGGSGKTFSQGDSNYDGVVNFDDLLALAQRYGTSLFSASPITSATTKTRGGSRDILA